MCTAITMFSEHFLFGRNLDWKDLCGGSVVICPRNFPFEFNNGKKLQNHYAIIGVAAFQDGYPLYFDGTNEVGLSIAGLNFPNHAYYHPFKEGRNNLAPYELIPWLLSICRDLEEARCALGNINLWAKPFSEELPLTPLHWLIADKTSSIVLESTREGLQIYENPFGVLTNSPPFSYHATHIAQYMGLSCKNPINHFSEKLPLTPYSFGMGSIGLPGDPSSPSRFVRAAFTKWNSPPCTNVPDAICQFFHVLTAVMQPKGITQFEDGSYEFTVYSSCCDATEGIYYYKTYHGQSIHAVDLHRTDLFGKTATLYPICDELIIREQN